MKIEAGLVLADRYRLLSRIAIGGMGEVWRARDTHLNIIVAVKILRDELVGQEQFLNRLRVEAENAKKVMHPNLARVLDHDETNGRGWIAMEFVQGQPLSKRLVSGSTIRVRELLPILIQISNALFALHSVGVVHRDVKPANILVTDEGVVKLTDFGISKSDSQPNMTAVGMVMGTAQYLAPEQVLGEAASPRGDIYALGIIAYEAVVGNRPYTGKTQVDIAFAHVNETLPPLPAFIPPALSTVIEKMLAKSPEDRFENADVLAKQLHKVMLQICPDVVVPNAEITTFERPLTRRETLKVPKISADPDIALQQTSESSSFAEHESPAENVSQLSDMYQNITNTSSSSELGHQPNDSENIDVSSSNPVEIDEQPTQNDERISEKVVKKTKKMKVYRRGGLNHNLKTIQKQSGKDSSDKSEINLSPKLNQKSSSLSNMYPNLNTTSIKKIKNVKKYFSRDKFLGKTFDEIIRGDSDEDSKQKISNTTLLTLCIGILLFFALFFYFVFTGFSSLLNAHSHDFMNKDLYVEHFGNIFSSNYLKDFEMLFVLTVVPSQGTMYKDKISLSNRMNFVSTISCRSVYSRKNLFMGIMEKLFCFFKQKVSHGLRRK